MSNLSSESSNTSEPKASKQAKESKELQSDSNPDQRTPAEWITFGIASGILLTLVGLVITVWIDPRHQQPPLIETAQAGVIWESSGQFYVPFTVTNTGGGTAESVQITAELEIDGEVVESGEQQIDFLSGGEAETGAFIFSQNPQQGTLKLRAAGYKLP
jgi:uncharacterized protein (TIGR02588 family)